MPAGAVTVLRGANGSGKSTLLAIVATLAAPTSGSVTYGALGRSRARVRAALGWVSGEACAYPDLSPRENLAFFARLYAVSRAAEESAIARLELEPFADRPLHACSRGQRQRFALARALLHGPSLVVLDEPTNALDVGGVARLAAIVREETARGATVIVATHDDAFAGRVADHELGLVRGRVAPAIQRESQMGLVKASGWTPASGKTSS